MKKFIIAIAFSLSFSLLGLVAQNTPADPDGPASASSNKQSGSKQSGASDTESARGGDDSSPALEDAPGSRVPADDESSSDSTKVNLSPPPGETDFRTGSGDIDTRSSVHEAKPWDPHKSDKDVEVGDFYFKRHNYEAAESRYREALHWMDNNAIASFRLAQALEQLGRNQEAVKYYNQYLSILPQGTESKQARQSIEKLANKPDQPKNAAAQQELKVPEENR